MEVDLGIWSRLTRLAVALLCAAVVVAVGVWYKPQIEKNEAMRGKLLQLEEQIRKEDETRRWLRSAVEGSNDPRTLERWARESLGYARTGEVVVRFEEPRR